MLSWLLPKERQCVRLVHWFDCNNVALFNQLQCCLPAPRRYEDRPILALGEILSQWLGNPAIWVAMLGLNIKVCVEKETSIVDVIEDKNPLSLLNIVQPVVHELEYVGLGIPPPKGLNLVCNIPIDLDPENPGHDGMDGGRRSGQCFRLLWARTVSALAAWTLRNLPGGRWNSAGAFQISTTRSLENVGA
jgi:hypothetical protein